MLLADFLAAAVPILPFVFLPIAEARIVSAIVTTALLIGLGVGRARIAKRNLDPHGPGDGLDRPRRGDGRRRHRRCHQPRVQWVNRAVLPPLEGGGSGGGRSRRCHREASRRGCVAR